jgi:hypothetical protein
MNKGIWFLKKNKPVVITLIFLAIFADIIFITGNSDIRIFGILGTYIMAVFFYKLKSRLTLLFGLALLGIMYIEFLFTRTSESTENAAVWLYLFLAIGIIQKLRE